MAGAAGISRISPANRWGSSSCPVSLCSASPLRLSLSRNRSRGRIFCFLRRNPSILRVRAFANGEDDYLIEDGPRSDLASVEGILVFVETLFIAPSVFLIISCFVNLIFRGRIKFLQFGLGNTVLVYQIGFLVGAVVVGRMIRRLQWQRFCRMNGSNFSLLDRIEKVEDELRRSTGIIHALSRQLEKLGIRFRVTRRTLKDPISETAALAQKNSEATRALAMRVDILEKELGEIQKVLLAMQDQQRKQLELILAIGKSGNLIDGGKGEPATNATTPVRSPSPKKTSSQIPSPTMDLNAGKVRTSANEHP